LAKIKAFSRPPPTTTTHMKIYTLYLKDRKDAVTIHAESYKLEPAEDPKKVIFISSGEEVAIVLMSELQALSTL
jgi:hypothetical protein